MKIRILTIIIAAFAIISTAGCKGTRDVPANTGAVSSVPREAMLPASQALPKAVVYSTNGDFANNVMVMLDPDNGSLVTYPAPTDITSQSTPIDLGDGVLLSRQGAVGATSAFLDYTYKEYSQLPEVPSPAQLKQHIIPGACVTWYMELPVNLNEALANPETVKKYLPKHP